MNTHVSIKSLAIIKSKLYRFFEFNKVDKTINYKKKDKGEIKTINTYNFVVHYYSRH